MGYDFIKNERRPKITLRWESNAEEYNFHRNQKALRKACNLRNKESV